MTSLDVEDVRIKGSWDGWQKANPMKRVFNLIKGIFENQINLSLKNGEYHYKFLLNGHYCHDPNHTYKSNSFDSYDNVLLVQHKENEKGAQNFLNASFEWHKIEIFGKHWNNKEILQGYSMNQVGNSIYIYGGINS